MVWARRVEYISSAMPFTSTLPPSLTRIYTTSPPLGPPMTVSSVSDL